MENEGREQLFTALARLVNAGADALSSYTKLQEKRAEYFANAANQIKVEAEKPFEQYQPGFFENQFNSRK